MKATKSILEQPKEKDDPLHVCGVLEESVSEQWQHAEQKKLEEGSSHLTGAIRACSGAGISEAQPGATLQQHSAVTDPCMRCT